MVKYREIEFSSEYARFLRKKYLPLFCYVCLKDFKEGEKLVSQYSNRLKIRHLTCWLKLWQGEENIDMTKNIFRNPKGRYGRIPDLQALQCPKCKGRHLWKKGHGHRTRSQVKQIWECRDCGHRFCEKEEMEVLVRG